MHDKGLVAQANHTRWERAIALKASKCTALGFPPRAGSETPTSLDQVQHQGGSHDAQSCRNQGWNSLPIPTCLRCMAVALGTCPTTCYCGTGHLPPQFHPNKSPPNLNLLHLSHNNFSFRAAKWKVTPSAHTFRRRERERERQRTRWLVGYVALLPSSCLSPCLLLQAWLQALRRILPREHATDFQTGRTPRRGRGCPPGRLGFRR